MKRIILVLGIILMGLAGQAQNKSAKITFEVDGVCMMCKKRIEKAALKTKGVKMANWNVKSHQLSLIINEKKTNKETVQQAIANVGHDTGKFIAPQKVYDNLPACCKYRDKKDLKKTEACSETDTK